MDIEGLYVIVKQSNEFNKTSFERLESVINAQNSHTRAKMEAVEHGLKQDIIELREHQEKSNGRIAKSEQAVQPLKWVKKHPILCIIIFVLLTYITNLVLTVFSLKELIQMTF